jgi:hypothetical protein
MEAPIYIGGSTRVDNLALYAAYLVLAGRLDALYHEGNGILRQPFRSGSLRHQLVNVAYLLLSRRTDTPLLCEN